MAITFLFCLLFGRFFYVQVLWQEELNYRALDQWTRELPIVADRGKITDRNGVVIIHKLIGAVRIDEGV